VHAIKSMFGNAAAAAFPKNLNFFFLLKFNMVCTFWIVLMCWCQKWFLKNEKISLTCSKNYLKSTRNHTAKHALNLQHTFHKTKHTRSKSPKTSIPTPSMMWTLLYKPSSQNSPQDPEVQKGKKKKKPWSWRSHQ
jgi:hypothetical protein